ncbi:MAG: ATP-binding cassette domain-containing protein, partial [Firmicutes bacterium]|nr:ATP-binding cassette domain-containing protein [Bacillota bacterium]
MNPVLSVHDVRVKRGGHEILSIKEMAVAEAEVLAIIGPNGAGKSTLLAHLACLD